MLDMSTEGWINNEIRVIQHGINQNASDDVIFLMEGKVNKLEKILEEIKNRKEFKDSDIILIQQEINEHKKQLNDVLTWRVKKEAALLILKKVIGQIKVDEDTRSSKIANNIEQKEEIKSEVEDPEISEEENEK
jgi:hypothetical protein